MGRAAVSLGVVLILAAGVSPRYVTADPLKIEFNPSEEDLRRVSIRNMESIRDRAFPTNPLTDVEEEVQRKMTRAYLVSDDSGVVWIEESPRIPLGMGATLSTGYAFDYRLSPTLRQRLAPLTNHFADRSHGEVADGRVARWFPHPINDGDPAILVSFEFGARLIEQTPIKLPAGSPITAMRLVYEATGATLLAAEYVSHESLEAWERLDRILDEIVAETLKPAGEGKRQRVQELIDEGGRCLAVLESPEIREDWEDTVRSINPEARIGTRFLEEKAERWGKVLSICSQRLGIAPANPIPDEIQRSATFGGDEATDRPSHVTVEDAGLVVSAVDEEFMTGKLILGGIIIDDVLPGGKDSGLRPGDIILTCSSVYDVVMGTGLRSFYGMEKEPEMLGGAVANILRQELPNRGGCACPSRR